MLAPTYIFRISEKIYQTRRSKHIYLHVKENLSIQSYLAKDKGQTQGQTQALI